jgi:hypothetical protein
MIGTFAVSQVGANIAATASSLAVALPMSSAANIARYYRVISNGEAFIKTGVIGVTAVAGDMMITAQGGAVMLTIPAAHTHIAAIATSTATVNIVPLDDM